MHVALIQPIYCALISLAQVWSYGGPSATMENMKNIAKYITGIHREYESKQ